MKRLAILGAGDLGKLIAHHAKLAGTHEVIGYFDDTHPEASLVSGIKVLGPTSLATENSTLFDEIIIAIGYRHMEARKKFFDRVDPNKIASIIAKNTFIDPTVQIGKGSVILPGTTIDHGCVIENNVLLNVGCTIAHDTRIGKHSFLGPACRLAGFVNVGEMNFLGIGTTIIDKIKTCPGTRTGASALLTQDIREPGLYVGVPAKLMSERSL